VDVENDVAFGREKSTEIHQVTIATRLHFELGRWHSRQVGCHDSRRSAIEGKRRLQHPAVADCHELLHSASVRLVKKFDRIWAIFAVAPPAELMTRVFVPWALPRRCPFIRRNNRASADVEGLGDIFGAFHGNETRIAARVSGYCYKRQSEQCARPARSLMQIKSFRRICDTRRSIRDGSSMAVSTQAQEKATRGYWWFPPARWLREYRASWLSSDAVAGMTLAAYAIPVSLAYAALAGLPPQVGVYGYLLGGLGYALLGSSRQLAVGPTSAISLMVAATVGAMAEGDAQRYAQIASLAAFTVAGLCLFAWLLRLSVLVKLISDSILVGFKAGAGLTIAMTQLPSLFGVPGGGHNFFERAVLFIGQLGQTNFLVLVVGVVAIALLVFGERLLPGRPIALAVVALSIVAATLLGLQKLGVPITGEIPAGLPSLA